MTFGGEQVGHSRRVPPHGAVSLPSRMRRFEESRSGSFLKDCFRERKAEPRRVPLRFQIDHGTSACASAELTVLRTTLVVVLRLALAAATERRYWADGVQRGRDHWERMPSQGTHIMRLLADLGSGTRSDAPGGVGSVHDQADTRRSEIERPRWRLKTAEFAEGTAESAIPSASPRLVPVVTDRGTVRQTPVFMT